MKTKLIITLIWFTLIGLILMIGLNSCSANYHLTKFINKGGKIDTITKVVTVEKTIKVNGKDSIIFVQMPLNCPDVQIPPTRQEIRYKYRLKRDSIETVRYVTKWKVKEHTRTVRIEDKSKKKSNWLMWLVVGFGIAQGLNLAWFIIKRK
jgi:hypothetical protein